MAPRTHIANIQLVLQFAAMICLERVAVCVMANLPSERKWQLPFFSFRFRYMNQAILVSETSCTVSFPRERKRLVAFRTRAKSFLIGSGEHILYLLRRSLVNNWSKRVAEVCSIANLQRERKWRVPFSLAWLKESGETACCRASWLQFVYINLLMVKVESVFAFEIDGALSS